MKTLLCSMLALASIGLAGCGPRFDRLELSPQTSPPMPVTLAYNQVSIPVGVAVAVTPIALSGGEPMDDAEVELVSNDASVLGVDREYEGGYVIYGVNPGHTRITIWVDGDSVGDLPATVTSQPL